MINNQPAEKKDLQVSGSLEVHSIFSTIQGEGPFCGQRAIFIRLAGCNLQCPGCDTDYTSTRELVTVLDLFTRVIDIAVPPYLVVITGGEPFRQNISPLCNCLIDYGFAVQIESNGTLPPSSGLDEKVQIVCSPKTGSINPKIAERMNALKYVLHHQDRDLDDGLPNEALGHTAEPVLARPPADWDGPIYIQPEDSQSDRINALNIGAAKSSCLRNGHILQLQIHKLIGVE